MSVTPFAPSDLPHLVRLSSELGYPSTPDEIENRLRLIQDNPTHFVRLFQNEDGKTVGFIHAHLFPTLMSNPKIEIAALVVDPSARKQGAGRALVESVKEWARSRDVFKVRLGSRTSRTDAHEFYKRIGFKIEKTWYVFEAET